MALERLQAFAETKDDKAVAGIERGTSSRVPHSRSRL